MKLFEREIGAVFQKAGQYASLSCSMMGNSSAMRITTSWSPSLADMRRLHA